MSNPKPSLVAHITEYEMYLALRYLKGLKMLHQKRYLKDEYIYPLRKKRLESVPCYCRPSKKHILCEIKK